MSKINYGLMLDKKLAELEKNGEKPSLLLHACCAPCSSHVLEFLHERFEITLYFCNPNIAPEEEYNYRSSELKRLVREMGLDVKIIEEAYDPQPFYELAKGLENLPERGERCRKCIGYRLEMAGAKAAELNYDCFTTTLTISPHKDCEFINEFGAQVQEKCGVSYLFSDFKKHEGYKRSIELSRKYDLYRQDYCGCIYSKLARETKNET
ncbi:MAG: epoxyqueuosine reductase QueH [Ruminococcus sp.]|nr:epoxyqueuosine reductase QueH [Ruminococcus sp.]